MESHINVYRKNVGELLEEVVIKNDLATLQEVVEGHIEYFPLQFDILMVLNEDGMLKNLPRNFNFSNGIIHGDVLFVGRDGEEICSLSERQKTVLENWMGTVFKY